MRYLLIALGVICVVLGLLSAVGHDPSTETCMIIAGAILLSIGSATCDIVNAMNPPKS